jgi:hypothetical protein
MRRRASALTVVTRSRKSATTWASAVGRAVFCFQDRQPPPHVATRQRRWHVQVENQNGFRRSRDSRIAAFGLRGFEAVA